MLKMERHIDIDRFDYDLPDERIAKYPLEERSASKLLVYERGEISERRFRDIGDILPEGTLLVFNNTKVIRARIIMHKPSGCSDRGILPRTARSGGLRAGVRRERFVPLELHRG